MRSLIPVWFLVFLVGKKFKGSFDFSLLIFTPFSEVCFNLFPRLVSSHNSYHFICSSFFFFSFCILQCLSPKPLCVFLLLFFPLPFCFMIRYAYYTWSVRSLIIITSVNSFFIFNSFIEFYRSKIMCLSSTVFLRITLESL